MTKRIFDPLTKAGVKQTLTSFKTATKILTDAKIKSTKMGVTMTSYFTAAIIQGSPQIKTKKDVIAAICKEMDLDEALILKLADEQSQGTSLIKSKNVEGGVNK